MTRKNTERIELARSTLKIIPFLLKTPKQVSLNPKRDFVIRFLNFSSGIFCVIRWGEEKRGEGCRSKSGFQIQNFHLRKGFCGLT